ncbi:hypothetical protein [Shewanella waksmanii]|uniref:hypothetical protein n=1 Tax=Shewanella waksmanii TaxID=213783 RepID=UPI0004907C45|nr:hypothetical protein [Shewanella waksmanii]
MLTEQENTILRNMGVSKTAFLKMKNQSDSTFSQTGLSEQELAVCKRTGVSAEAFLVQKNQT